jgi:hypothetical protein
MMHYSAEETIKRVNQALKGKVSELYKTPCINWLGKTKGQDEKYYSEIIAEYLGKKEAIMLLDGIKKISRKNYMVDSHFNTKKPINLTNRREEIRAKTLKLTANLDKLGYVVDYQIPLCAAKRDGAGKIDLCTFKAGNDKKCSFIYIIEMKVVGNKETLLRAALEIWTYYHQLDKDNFLESYPDFNNSNNIKPGMIKKAVLCGIGSNAYKEAKDLDNRPCLRSMIKKLGIEVFLFDKIEQIKID